ncbi:hypothetical protein BDK51DRAFT_39094 [Blyttiomyces helicus]|uniref:Transmembrane protein n=1 Tax=Blyttiomyces helicus TaxID=388810 RepID=A0A4P9WN21_9FUNG|nr:hypothetical protein BDK51DRAFT_39094 [Blyttiomyces helicus]|eukprot:RKO93645.1 hypothetical protein BDK51DRAFT_39094 [Blyttiomyces helicus]
MARATGVMRRADLADLLTSVEHSWLTVPSCLKPIHRGDELLRDLSRAAAMLLFLWTISAFALSNVVADCCYTAVPTFLQPFQFLLNVTLSSSDGVGNLFYVEVAFLQNYTMGPQPFAAPLGTVKCSQGTQSLVNISLPVTNRFQCTSQYATVFSAQFSMTTPGNSNGSPSVTVFNRGTNGTYYECTQQVYCAPAIQAPSENGNLYFGAFGWLPTYFVGIFAAAGGLLAALVFYGVIQYRNAHTQANEKRIADRYEAEQGAGAIERGMQRTPQAPATTPKTGAPPQVGRSGTLIGDKLQKEKSLRQPKANTLLETARAQPPVPAMPKFVPGQPALPFGRRTEKANTPEGSPAPTRAKPSITISRGAGAARSDTTGLTARSPRRALVDEAPRNL